MIRDNDSLLLESTAEPSAEEAVEEKEKEKPREKKKPKTTNGASSSTKGPGHSCALLRCGGLIAQSRSKLAVCWSACILQPKASH